MKLLGNNLNIAWLIFKQDAYKDNSSITCSTLLHALKWPSNLADQHFDMMLWKFFWFA